MEEMIDTSGFYKRDGEQLLYGPNFVLNADYELRRETREQNALPVDGWQWFDTAAEAYVASEVATQDEKDAWEFATEFREDNPLLVNAASMLGITDLHAFIEDAQTL